MSIEDYYFGDTDCDGDDGDITCNRCGEDGLYWADRGNGWRLYDTWGDLLHECHKPSPDAFEDIS